MEAGGGGGERGSGLLPKRHVINFSSCKYEEKKFCWNLSQIFIKGWGREGENRG